MSGLKEYILCVAAAAIMIGILADFSNPKSAPGAVFRMSAGLFLMIQILSPVTDLDPQYWTDYFSGIMSRADTAVAVGKDLTSEQAEQLIMEKTRAYILDMAQSFQADLDVEVELDESDIPVPVAVRLSGDISPYGKATLQRKIEADLNIPKERQLWIGN